MILIAVRSVVARVGAREVLSDVSLELAAGELVALCGPNGAGKSSVIRVALGLLPVSKGEALLGADAVRTLGPRDRAARTAYLPQERRIAWNLPAVEVAALGAPFLAGEVALARARAALVEVGAGHLADRGVADMSGGERARVLLARAFAADAPALLADEPAAGLDPDAQLMVMERLKARSKAGQGVLVSLHDLNLAAAYADRVVVIHEGRMAADDAPLKALRPDILKQVFGLDGRWIEGPDGPLLSVRRA